MVRRRLTLPVLSTVHTEAATGFVLGTLKLADSAMFVRHQGLEPRTR